MGSLVTQGALKPALLLVLMGCALAASAAPAPRRPVTPRVTVPKGVAAALKSAGVNRPELEAAWRKVPAPQREGLRFLLENMPEQDLKTLSAGFLLGNVSQAYEALAKAPWKASIPKDVFLNDVLPYACLNERRDVFREDLRAKCLPLIEGCKTATEAIRRLNEKLFPLVNVRYSTERKRPDQSPIETMESGKATCSGLSILLVDACRSVGIPARVAGTPLWTNMRGNHTWVEAWDGGWHFLGAAEPDPQGLDRGWFVGDASKAIKDQPEHAIYASSFRKTGLAFPLVWARDLDWVPAVNVTDRYTGKAPAADPAKTRLLVKVVDAKGKRVVAKVTVKGPGDLSLSGTSKPDTADMNDHLGFAVPKSDPPARFTVTAEYQGQTAAKEVSLGPGAETLVTLTVAPRAGSGASRAPAKLSPSQLPKLLHDRFGTDEAAKAAAEKALQSVPYTPALGRLAWGAYRASSAHAALRQEFDQKIVATADRRSPYLWRTVGTKPADGWALVIAMHGGGGAPKAVNDREWEGMFSSYYHDHPEAGGYVYLALRAPNDEWNGFYDDAICPLVERLIQQFVLFADVNPSRVYTLGASHGGYGAFVIGPKIPYRFAAIHASASAPTDGETLGENLRDVPFTYMVGVLDTAYGRADRCQKFAQKVEEWRKEYGGYPGRLELKENTGHFVPDRDKLAEMLKSEPRDAWPKQVVWTQSDTVLQRFYWLEAPKPAEGGHLEAKVEGNRITLKADKQSEVALWLDAKLVDLTKPVTVAVEGGPTQTLKLKPTLGTYCFGLERTADPNLAAPVRVVVPLTR
ncbi:MAG TPA: transglutaminase domain-containing protein [Armatimonadota bacterium]|jgi:transglutaminase-like putative cysteine protease